MLCVLCLGRLVWLVWWGRVRWVGALSPGSSGRNRPVPGVTCMVARVPKPVPVRGLLWLLLMLLVVDELVVGRVEVGIADGSLSRVCRQVVRVSARGVLHCLGIGSLLQSSLLVQQVGGTHLTHIGHLHLVVKVAEGGAEGGRRGHVGRRNLVAGNLSLLLTVLLVSLVVSVVTGIRFAGLVSVWLTVSDTLQSACRSVRIASVACACAGRGEGARCTRPLLHARVVGCRVAGCRQGHAGRKERKRPRWLLPAVEGLWV